MPSVTLSPIGLKSMKRYQTLNVMIRCVLQPVMFSLGFIGVAHAALPTPLSDPTFDSILETLEPVGDFVGGLMIIIGVSMGVARQSLGSAVMGIGTGGFLIGFPILAKTVISDTSSAQTESGSFISILAFMCLVLTGFGYKIWSTLVGRHLDLTPVQAHSEAGSELELQPNDRTPPSVEELQQRQENSSNNTPAEPRVISQESAPTVEIKKNQRKIVVD